MEFNPKLSKNDLCTFLVQKGIEEDDAKKIKEEKIDGDTFQDLSEEDLKEIGVKLGTRKKIMRILQNLKVVQNNQTYAGNAQLQDLQILGGGSIMSDSLVFDLITAGTSCTILPTVTSSKSLTVPPADSSSVSSTKSLSISSTKSSSVSSTKSSSVTSTKSVTTYRRKSAAVYSTHRIPLSLLEGDRGESNPRHQINTYTDVKTIDVRAMLEDHESGKKILGNLKTGKGIRRCDVNEIVRIVIHALVVDLGTLYPTSQQKINLAKAIVRDIPELKSNRDGVEGYEQFFDPNNNSGTLEWRLKTLRLGLPASKKKNRPSSSKESSQSEEKDISCEPDVIEKVEWLKLQSSTEVNRAAIMAAMAYTFSVRRNFIMKTGASISEIIDEYPKLKDFDGALIDAEFKQMYPDAANLLEIFPEYSEKIRLYVSKKRRDIEDRLGHVTDENLKSMMYLADLLPLNGKRKMGDEHKARYPSDCLITFAGVESSIPQEETCKFPRLVCCGEAEDEKQQYFLVLDKEYVDLGKCFIKAFDILYKSHYVFNLQYPRNLLAFYNFLDHMIYKVITGAARSAVEHLHNIICCVT